MFDNLVDLDALMPIMGFRRLNLATLEDVKLKRRSVGSVGGCSNNQLEPNQKEWIYKTAVGDMEAVSRLLLQDRTLVKYKDFISGYTGLHWACKLGRLDMVHVLVAADSDVNVRAYNGMTPLHIAAQCGHEPVIHLLIKEKADKLVRDNNGRYPVYYLSKSLPDRIKELLSPPPRPTVKPRSHPPHSDLKSTGSNFSLRRHHKREKSDTNPSEHRSKSLNNNFRYQALNKQNKRPLSGIRIDHITLDGSCEKGAVMVRSKEEALESVCSNSTLSPRSVKRISLGTPLSALYDMEPLLLHHHSGARLNHVEFGEVVLEEEKSASSSSSLLCCCPRRKKSSRL